MRTRSVVGWALVAALAGCGAESPDLAAMKIELNALKHELEYLRQQTEDLDPRVRTAEQMALQSLARMCAASRGRLVTPSAR